MKRLQVMTRKEYCVVGSFYSRVVQQTPRMRHRRRYNWTMTTDMVRDYLSTQLPLELNAQQHFRLLRTVFALVFISTVVIHLLDQQEDAALGILIHATTIGLLYVIGIGIATSLLYGLRNAMHNVHVWHVWTVSLTGFILGYYFLPLDDLVAGLLGVDSDDHVGALGFFRLLPVWFVLTYLIVQPYLNASLRSELARLRDVNEMLEGREKSPGRDDQPIHFESGRTEFTLTSDVIRNVVVDDHYCYVHYRHHDRYAKRDLAVPLRDILALLPSDFVQVHRSHVVNLHHIESIARRGRSIYLTLDDDCQVPVSRHRLQEVLPLIRQHTGE